MAIARFVVLAVVVGVGAAGVSCVRRGEKVHDRAFSDNRAWNAHEAFIFRRHWADEHGGTYRPFQKLARQEQIEYWNWRHAHPD